MTLDNFKAWLEGYSLAIRAAPDEAQWAVIRAKLATVSDAPYRWPYYPGGIQVGVPFGPAYDPLGLKFTCGPANIHADKRIRAS